MYFLPPRIHYYSFKNNKKPLKGLRTLLMGYPVHSPIPLSHSRGDDSIL